VSPIWGRRRDGAKAPSGPEQLIEQAIEIYGGGSISPESRARVRAMADEALRLEPKCHSAHVLLGYLDMDDRNLPRMQEHFLKALEMAPDPHDEYTWDWVITCLDDGLKDYHRLAEYLTKFYERKPEEFVAAYLAETYMKMSQKENALFIVNRHLSVNPDSKRMRKLMERIERKG
jgi:lipopolysaccharide biosynthesis regulator YciM